MASGPNVWCYSGPNGESVPHETCRTCWGSGWVSESGAFPAPEFAPMNIHVDGLTALVKQLIERVAALEARLEETRR